MRTVRSRCLATAVMLALASPVLAADGRVVGGAGSGEPLMIEPQPQSWGGTSDSVLVIGVGNILPRNDSVTWDTVSPQSTGVGMYQTSAGTGSWISQLQLPSGALLQRVEMEACDVSATAAVNFGMSSGLVPGGAAGDITAVGTTGTSAVPGCAFFSIPPTATTTIDNAARNYWLFLFWSGTGFGPTVQFHSFRVYYRLQVSPAPATATFPSDVPITHPFFRFVEAMAASGLTGGCATGSFCPDSPVTRGQLAVFLASALGLHFPD